MLKKMKAKALGVLLIVGSVLTASAQAFDPAVKAQEAVDIGGSVFAIVFGAIISIVLGLMVIKYVRKQ